MKIQLNLEFVRAVRGPIQQTWNYIGSDAMECGEMDPEIAIEMCIDAGRLTTCGVDGGRPGRVNEALEEAKRAESLIRQAINDHGYTKVLKFLAREIPLV